MTLGHPIGSSGAVLAAKAVYDLHRAGGLWALVTAYIGGRPGIAGVCDRL